LKNKNLPFATKVRGKEMGLPQPKLPLTTKHPYKPLWGAPFATKVRGKEMGLPQPKLPLTIKYPTNYGQHTCLPGLGPRWPLVGARPGGGRPVRPSGLFPQQGDKEPARVVEVRVDPDAVGQLLAA
jgi:hypothetical protein